VVNKANFFFFFFGETVYSSSFLRNTPQRIYTTRENNTRTRARNTITTPKGKKQSLKVIVVN